MLMGGGGLSCSRIFRESFKRVKKKKKVRIRQILEIHDFSSLARITSRNL